MFWFLFWACRAIVRGGAEERGKVVGGNKLFLAHWLIWRRPQANTTAATTFLMRCIDKAWERERECEVGEPVCGGVKSAVGTLKWDTDKKTNNNATRYIRLSRSELFLDLHGMLSVCKCVVVCVGGIKCITHGTNRLTSFVFLLFVSPSTIFSRIFSKQVKFWFLLLEIVCVPYRT